MHQQRECLCLDAAHSCRGHVLIHVHVDCNMMDGLGKIYTLSGVVNTAGLLLFNRFYTAATNIECRCLMSTLLYHCIF